MVPEELGGGLGLLCHDRKGLGKSSVSQGSSG
jgi:hypothetical protein